MIRHNFIGLAYQFWDLTRESIVEMEKLENRKMIFYDYDASISEEDSWKKYEYDTRWNDFNVGVPVLFNFYHGLELFMKGLLQEIGKLDSDKMNHKLTDLFHEIADNQNSFTYEIIELLKYYLDSENPFQQFFKDNEGDINDFYLFLRYPTTKNRKRSYTFKEVRGNEQIGLDRFRNIKKGCANLKKAYINWKN